MRPATSTWLRLLEIVQLVGGEDLLLDQGVHRLHPIDVFGDPVERLQVAQPAFALFDVGLHDVALAAVLFEPLAALVKLGFHELGACLGEQGLP